MKASAKIISMLILMVSFVGFGTTTADLDQNSKPKIEKTQLSQSVDKQEVLIKVETINELADENRFKNLFAEADKSFNDEYRQELEALKIKTEKLAIVLKPETKLRCNYDIIRPPLIRNYNLYR